MPNHCFLITGGSGGFGLAIGRAALNAGQKAVLTSRNVEKAKKDFPDIEQKGGQWVQLDVTDRGVATKVTEAVDKWDVDVLVNNAGISYTGAVEDFSEEEVQAQMDCNLYGPLRMMKAVIPKFRERGSGTIVNVSSGAAFLGLPGRGLYAASKAALETVVESIAAEIAPFNIRSIIVDLGAFRTPFAGNLQTPISQGERHVSEAYKGSNVDKLLSLTRDLTTTANGDTDKAATRVVEAVMKTGLAGDEKLSGYHRLILGTDCLKRAREVYQAFTENTEAMAEVARSTDIEKS